MTSKLGPFAALALLITSSHAAADDEFMPFTMPIAFDQADDANETIGKLSFRGGVEIEPGEEELGSISGLTWWDGKLYAVSESGEWVVLTPSEIGDRLTDVIAAEKGDLRDTKGKPLARKGELTPSAIMREPAGTWILTVAGSAMQYVDLGGDAQLAATALTSLSAAEAAAAALPLPEALAGGGAASGSACASNGVCYVLFRGISEQQQPTVAIAAIGPQGLHEVLASWSAPLAFADFQGLAVREAEGKTYLYLVSDNGGQDDSNTLLLKFEVDAHAAATPGVAPKVYATRTVVLETRLGDITVALETERAPISAANFLRYARENRFDGTKCYRAMRVDGAQEPAGFLQCGTQNAPDRILAGIAHEPTSETGLSHTDGALSMARFAPGTATGDFSIMIGDQRGLDALPGSDDPERRLGYAVFGYVTDGMDVVHALHARPTDPIKGTGFLKGQLIANPVEITSVRVVEAP